MKTAVYNQHVKCSRAADHVLASSGTQDRATNWGSGL